MESIPKHLELDIERMSALYQKSRDEEMDLGVYINCTSVLNREPTKVEYHGFELYQLTKEIAERDREIEQEALFQDYMKSYNEKKNERI